MLNCKLWIIRQDMIIIAIVFVVVHIKHYICMEICVCEKLFLNLNLQEKH